MKTAARLPQAGGAAGRLALAALGLGMAAAGLWSADRLPAEPLFFVFVLLAGLVVGSLGLLVIGHLLSEEWLTPVRAEAEAAALTAPFLLAVAVPLTLALGELFPWAAGEGLELPRFRATFLTTPFFLLRGAIYLALWCALAVWLTRTDKPRRVSAIGLALLVPSAALAGNDWVLSRDPLWWSGLFGFAFAVSQLLAALAGGIFVSLLRPEHPSEARMLSLERALLTLALLTPWIWFVHFLIVWFGNLPNEGAWYLARATDRLWPLMTVTLLATGIAILILAPQGFGRRTMIAGSGLLLVQHVAHLLWLLRMSPDVLVGLITGGLLVIWSALFATALRSRPSLADERTNAAP